MEVNARLWPSPPAMAVTRVPEGRLTAVGSLVLVVPPLPNCPSSFSPQASAVSVTAAVVGGLCCANAGETTVACVTVTASASENHPAAVRPA